MSSLESSRRLLLNRLFCVIFWRPWGMSERCTGLRHRLQSQLKWDTATADGCAFAQPSIYIYMYIYISEESDKMQYVGYEHDRPPEGAMVIFDPPSLGFNAWVPPVYIV